MATRSESTESGIPLIDRDISLYDPSRRKPVPSRKSPYSDEDTKIALSTSVSHLVLRTLHHIIPVIASGGIISLSFATVYWQDLGNPNQNTILNTLQFVAKGHELLITVSLTAIVLHRIHYDLIHSGVSLGFLTSAFQLLSLQYLFSREFWGAATAGRTTKGASRWLPLWIIVPTLLLLATAVGPSSAIVMIPKPNWWRLQQPLSPLNLATFIPLGAQGIWPASLSGMSDITKHCLEDSSYADAGCPSAGFPGIKDWAAGYMTQVSPTNYTIADESSQTSRYMSSSHIDPGIGWAASSIVGARQAKDFGLFWQYLQGTNVTGLKPGRPKFSYSLRGLQSLKKPLVEVQCQQFIWNDTQAAFPTDLLKIRPINNAEPWLIPKYDYSQFDSHNDPVFFEFVSLEDQTNEALIGGAFVSTGQDGTTLVYPCTVASYWHPVRTWLDPKVDGMVLQDSPDPLELITQDRKRKETLFEPVRLETGWTDAINLAGYIDQSGHCGGLSLVAVSACQLGYYGFGDNTFRLSPFGAPTAHNPSRMPWLLSTILSMHVSEALSRVNVAHPTLVCGRQYPNHNTSDGLIQLDNRNAGNWAGRPDPTTYDGYMDRARTTNISHNTEQVWEFERFGYGWGFENGILVILAVAVLFGHAAVAILHVSIIVLGGWGVCASWSSMGEMMILGIGSTMPVNGLENTSAGAQRLSTWSHSVRVRERDMDKGGTKLELVLREDLELLNEDGLPSLGMVKPGKKYN